MFCARTPRKRNKKSFARALPGCGEGEDVVGVHTLLSGVVQVCHELLVGEEEEKEENRDGKKRRR